jgi:hypothetical protein
MVASFFKRHFWNGVRVTHHIDFRDCGFDELFVIANPLGQENALLLRREGSRRCAIISIDACSKGDFRMRAKNCVGIKKGRPFA